MTTPIAPAKSHKHAWITSESPHTVEWIGTDDERYRAVLVRVKKTNVYYVTNVTASQVCGVILRTDFVRTLKKGCRLPMHPQPHTTPTETTTNAHKHEHASNVRTHTAPEQEPERERKPALAQGDTSFGSELRALAAQFAKPRV